MAAALATVGLASPAHAFTWSYNASYAHYEQCSIPGAAGVANHTWLDYRCVTVIPDTTGPGRFDLYVERP
jgi:hypothetical protein